MAEEEKRSEPVTDKYELQKLKVLSFNLVMFLLVTTKNPLVCHLLHCLKSVSCFDLCLLEKDRRNTRFYNNGFHRSGFHLLSSHR